MNTLRSASAVIRPESAILAHAGVRPFCRDQSVGSVGPRHGASPSTPKLLRRTCVDMDNSVFVGTEATVLVQALRRTGVGRGLQIPEALLDGIHRYASKTRVFADRDERKRCPVQLATDPLVELIAATYLGSVPKLVGVDMWWTFACVATP